MNDEARYSRRFPWYELTRNIVLGTILTVLLTMQIAILSESATADGMAELARPLAIVSYTIVFFMFLPTVRWGANVVGYYAGRWWVNRGETA